MKNKIDIGEFTKKVFEKNTQSHQPDKMVLERIHKTLDSPKIGVKNTLFWTAFSVVLIGTITYFVMDSTSANLKDKNDNSLVHTTLSEQTNEISEEDLIGPISPSDLQHTNENNTTQENALNHYSLIIDTTQQNFRETISIEVKTKAEDTNFNIDELFKQKTIYHYYRASDSLRIETTDKRVIDSILSTKNNLQSTDSLQ
jgi:hypothetical protein